VFRINSPSHVRYADGRTHRKCGWSRCSRAVVVSSTRLRTRNSRSVARASSRVQCRTSWIVRRPSACRPCSVSTGPRCTSASQTCCSCSGDTSQVYNTRNISCGADHFRAVAKMMRDVTFPPVTKPHTKVFELLIKPLRTLAPPGIAELFQPSRVARKS